MSIILTGLSHEQWLTERAKDITSTDMAAVLGVPDTYRTRLDVWAEHSSLVPSDFTDNDRMLWGRRLEATIAAGVAEDHGLTITPLGGTYMRHDTLRAGSSFDYSATHPDRSGFGLLEIKNVDSLVFRNKWTSESGELEAPLQIEVQVQHQLWISGRQWAAIGVLVGGNYAHVLWRERDESAISAIEAAVIDFWASIDAKEMPSPDYNRDLDTLRAVFSKPDAKATVGEEAYARLADLLPAFELAKRATKDAKAAEDALKAELVHLIGGCEVGAVNGHGFSFKTQTASFQATEARIQTTRVLRTTPPKAAKRAA